MMSHVLVAASFFRSLFFQWPTTNYPLPPPAPLYHSYAMRNAYFFGINFYYILYGVSVFLPLFAVRVCGVHCVQSTCFLQFSFHLYSLSFRWSLSYVSLSLSLSFCRFETSLGFSLFILLLLFVVFGFFIFLGLHALLDMYMPLPWRY